MSFDGNINLYLERNVLVELQSGDTLSGVLDEDNRGILVGNTVVDPGQIRDILYCDKLDFENLVIKAGKLSTPDGFLLDPEELSREVGADFRYGEKIVEFVCHLVYDQSRGRMAIRDLRATRISHAVKRDVLESGAFLYAMDNGPYFYATLENGQLQGVDGPIPFAPDRISDITVCPQPGTSVTVILSDGQRISSVVAAVSPKGLVLVEGYRGRIPYERIRQFRYQGKMRNRTNGDGVKSEMCGEYRYRHRYLRQTTEYAFREGQMADYAVGMTSRGLMCKDVDLAPFDERREDYGVLAEYANTQGYGYVDPAYEHGTQCMRTYYLNCAALGKGWGNNDIDTHRYLYVVKFCHMPNPKHGNRAITSMEILEQYERSRYRSIQVDEKGNVKAEPFETPVDMTGVIEEGYGFLCFFGGDEKKSGNAYICSQVSQRGAEYQYFCYLAGFLAKCRGQMLDTKQNCYLVRYWVDKSQPKPDKLPVAYKVEFLDAYPKGRDYYVNEHGEVSDYNRMEFTVLDALRNERVVIITKDNNRSMGILQSNDADNAVLTISFADAQEQSFHYSRIAEVWGLGKVPRYDPERTFGFIQAGGGIYYKTSVVQSEKEPILETGELVGFRLERGKNGVQASLVRPLTEVLEEGYVTAANKNGTYQVIPGEIYGTEAHINRVPEQLRVQNPNMRFKNLAAQDYKVQVHSLYFLGGAPLLRGIEKHVGACNKLYFGCVEKFCDNPPASGKFSYGFLTPLDEEERERMPDGVYFNILQNAQMFAQVVEPGENPNKTDLCLVTYQLSRSQRKNDLCAVEMNFLARYPRTWFEQRMSSEQDVEPETVQPPRVSSSGESLQGRIHFLLKQNDVEAAKKLLEEYALENGGEDTFYYQQMNSICMKEYKHNHTQEVRLRWLDCIRKLRKAIEHTEQYGLRLDILYKQANLTMEEGRVPEALELYREWKRLLEEFCAIYPNKKKSYQNFVVRVDRILGTEGRSQETVDLGSEENGPSGVDLHAYLEWRLDIAGENGDDSLWAKARSLRQKSGESEYPEVLKAAVKAELAEIPEQRLRNRAHFAFLDLLLDPRSTTDALLPYFADALREDRTFARILSIEAAEPGPEAEVDSCSRFTLDSVILFATGHKDVRAWLGRFEDEQLRRRYVRELCYLTGERTERFDMEQLETVFMEAVAMLQQPVDANLQIHQYAAAVLRRTELFRRCGVAVSWEVDAVLQDLKDYKNRKGFSARMGCLRGNANKLQAYHQSIQKNPTVHDWNLLWPMCARLIGQIQRTWHTLLAIFVPSVEFGSLQAVREDGGTWKVTVPLRNSKNAQKASGIRIHGFEADPKNWKDLIADGFDHAFVIRVKPEDPDAEQLTLDLEVSYQYISDVQFRNDKYKLIDKKETVRKTVSVSCAANQRQELSLDIQNSFGYDAKENIDVTSPAGQAVAEILKNRSEEIATVIGAISTGEKGSRRLMRDGRWVALYGQWRVGKTVILHEVSRALRGQEFGDQAVTVYAQFGAGGEFEEETVCNICDAMDRIQDPTIAKLWAGHLDDWEETHGEIQTMRSLGRMLGRFHQMIAPKTIVLALDEFTAIYYAIKNGDVDVSFLRSFVDFIGQTGCIILTAGGEHTVRLMTDYDVNMLQKADCRLEVKYLSKEDTAKYIETVITVPSYLGGTEQKNRIINRIFELTQGNAFLLHKFCEALVRYVRETKSLVRIDDITIQETLDRIARSEPDVISVYFNSLYNPYNEKKDKRIDGFGDVRDMNLKILEAIVEHAFPETHSCRKDDLSRAFAGEPRFEEFLKVLIDRAVVKDDGGNISVPIDLYYEIQSRTKRKDDSNEF